MSEASKNARKALKSKAQRLAAPHKGAVDASGWTEPVDAGTNAQTGMRPVSKRQYKRGGKVAVVAKRELGNAEGSKADVRADRKPRASDGKAQMLAKRNMAPEGSKAEIRADRMEREDAGNSEMPLVDRFINADKKKANDYRDGPKQIGGMKSGGRAGKMGGGAMDPRVMEMINKQRGAGTPSPKMGAGIDPKIMAKIKRDVALRKLRAAMPMADAGGPGAGMAMPPPGAMKKGGRAEKMGGGGLYDSGMGRNVVMAKGGMAKHSDEALDRDLIKKMVKPVARTGKESGGAGCRPGKMSGGALSMPDDTYAKGGRARKGAGKGKMNVNIIIGGVPSGDSQSPSAVQPDRPPFKPTMAPPPGPPPGPPPVMMPPPPPDMPPGPPPGMMPPPGPGGPGGPGGPLMRPPGLKRGGRANYPHMEFAAGGGKGRLEKIKEYG